MSSRGRTTKQDVGPVDGYDPVFIIQTERGDGENQTLSFYCSEPARITGTGPEPRNEYAGGFGEIAGAIVFDNGSEARTTRNRLAKMYRDLDVEIRVKMYTRKEIFQARLK